MQIHTKNTIKIQTNTKQARNQIKKKSKQLGCGEFKADLADVGDVDDALSPFLMKAVPQRREVGGRAGSDVPNQWISNIGMWFFPNENFGYIARAGIYGVSFTSVNTNPKKILIDHEFEDPFIPHINFNAKKKHFKYNQDGYFNPDPNLGRRKGGELFMIPLSPNSGLWGIPNEAFERRNMGL